MSNSHGEPLRALPSAGQPGRQTGEERADGESERLALVVITPDEPPVMTPRLAAALLRLLRRAADDSGDRREAAVVELNHSGSDVPDVQERKAA